MDAISELADDLLLRILSLLPTKDVVTTMFLSKRWKFLWMFVPKLEYDDICQDIEGRGLFINKSFLLHKAHVLESLVFRVDQRTGATIDIGACAMKGCLRELIIVSDYSPSFTQTLVFFSRICFGAKLVTLILSNAVLVDFNSPVYLPSLEKLNLISIKFIGGDEFVQRLLSNCPVLEELVVERSDYDNVMVFTIRVPSLQGLKLTTSPNKAKDNAIGYVIDAPSLKLLIVDDYSSGFFVIEKKIPKIMIASLEVDYHCTKQLLGPIASSLQQLYICLSTSMNAYHEGRVYTWLVRLELCTCQTEWLNLLMRLLKDSPNLRFLKLEQYHQIENEYPRPRWSEPSYVPECLKSSLETFELVQYEGREEEKQVTRFILGNSSHLKKATFYFLVSTDDEEKFRMFLELSMLPMRSSMCELSFQDIYFV